MAAGFWESWRTALIIGAILLVACVETCISISFGVERPAAQWKQAGLTLEQAQKYIQDTGEVVIVDVRTRKEFSGSHLPNALNLPLHSFPQLAGSIPEGHPILIYCAYGFRSLQAYKLLRHLRPDIHEIWYVAGQLLSLPSH